MGNRSKMAVGLLAVALAAVGCGLGQQTVCAADDVDSGVGESAEGVFDDQVMFGVVSSSRIGLLAVGSDGPRDEDDASVWLSQDGVTWSGAPYEDGVFGGRGSQKMVDVVEGGPGFVAVGSSGTPGTEFVKNYDHSEFTKSGNRDAAVWTSVDGRQWCRIGDSDLGGRGWQSMVSLTQGGPGFVAVGFDSSGGDQDAAIWTSTDASTWTRVSHEESIFGGDDDQVMWSVTVGGPDLVAVGSDERSWPPMPLVWTSTDGVRWEKVKGIETPEGIGGRLYGVVEGGPGLIAVGEETNSSGIDAAIWTSADGFEWHRVTGHEGILTEGPPKTSRSIHDVVSGGPGFIAVGQQGETFHEDAAVWTSSDGLIWNAVEYDDSVFGGDGVQVMVSVTKSEWGLAAVGLHSDCSRALLECRGAENNHRDTAVWTSENGLTWTRIALS